MPWIKYHSTPAFDKVGMGDVDVEIVEAEEEQAYPKENLPLLFLPTHPHERLERLNTEEVSS